MIQLITTLVNIAGAVFTMIYLTLLIKNYKLSPKMGFYVFLSLMSMCLLAFVQAYALIEYSETGGLNWRVKSATFFWWAKTLYFAWAIRFSSLKK